jgi:hypothetical protein
MSMLIDLDRQGLRLRSEFGYRSPLNERITKAGKRSEDFRFERSAPLQRGWSQEALVARAGIHMTYLGFVERSERNVAKELRGRLGVRAFELLKN